MSHFARANTKPSEPPAAVVRLAALGEFAAIGELLMRANLEYRTLVATSAHDDYLQNLRSLSRTPHDKDFLVAERDGRLAGAVAFYRDASLIGFDLPREWAALRALAVDPSARGLGIGRDLTEACVRRAWRLGRAALCLHNAAVQSAARALYLSMGFERCPQYDIITTDVLDSASRPITVEAFHLPLER